MTPKKTVRKCWRAFPKKPNAHHLHGHYYITLLEKPGRAYYTRCKATFNYTKNKGCVFHSVALPFTLKSMYLKAKEKLWKLKYFTMQNYNLEKNPLKETKILQDIATL
jgi:hypothetical protein